MRSEIRELRSEISLGIAIEMEPAGVLGVLLVIWGPFRSSFRPGLGARTCVWTADGCMRLGQRRGGEWRDREVGRIIYAGVRGEMVRFWGGFPRCGVRFAGRSEMRSEIRELRSEIWEPGSQMGSEISDEI